MLECTFVSEQLNQNERRKDLGLPAGVKSKMDRIRELKQSLGETVDKAALIVTRARDEKRARNVDEATRKEE